MNTTMRNFFKYALAGAAMMLLAASSVAQANETNRQIVVDLKHSTESWFRAETDGVYHRVLDDCATYQAPCRKRVRAEVRIEWAGGGRATLPYGINVQIGAERTGPFFPAYGANCTRRDMWVRIPAGQSSTSWPICLEMDEVAEVAATRDGLGSVVVGLKKVELIGKHRYYSRGPVMSTLKRGFAIVDPLVAGQIPEYRLVPKQTSVFEGEQITYELRGNKNPDFNMRVRVDYQFTNLDFFDVGSRYTNVLIPANSGEGRAGDYLFDTITINTVNDSVMESANGAIVARVGKKQSGFNWWAKSWELTSSERALQPSEISKATVTVTDNDRFGNYHIVANYSQLEEGRINNLANFRFQIETNVLPTNNLRIRVDFTYTGDFFATSSDHQYLNIYADPQSHSEGTTVVTGVPLPAIAIEDEIEEADGSITARIGRKQLGFSEGGQDIPLTADELAISATILILDDDVGKGLQIEVAGSDLVDTDGNVTFNLKSPTQISEDLRVTVSFSYSGQTTVFGSTPSEQHPVVSSNSGRLQADGTYQFNTVRISTNGEATGVATVTAAITSISRNYNLADGTTSTWTRTIPEVDQTTATITVADFDAIPVFSFLAPAFVAEGNTANFHITTPQALRPRIDLRITINYEFTGDFFDNPASTATVDLGPTVGLTSGGFYISLSTSVATVDDDVDEPNGSIVASISQIRLGHSDTAALFPLRESDRSLTRTVIVTDHDDSPTRSSRSLAADAYRHVVGTHESDVVEQSTSATQAQLAMAFNRRSDVNVQSFVNSIGNAVNSDTDLSELVNLPSFTLPLSAETEVSGPITMWGASNSSDTLAVGQFGMDLIMHNSYLFGLTVTDLESELSDDISEDMSMVQSYVAYKSDLLDTRISAIAGIGSGDLRMEKFDTFDSSRTLLQLGLQSDFHSYKVGTVDGELEMAGTVGLSKHSVAETSKFDGWSTIGRDAAMALTNTNTVSTSYGDFSPVVWIGIDDQIASGGGFTFTELNLQGLSTSAWFNGESPDSTSSFSADIQYGFAASDVTSITPSLSLTASDGFSHIFGLNLTSDELIINTTVNDNRQFNINGSIRW